MRRLSLISKLKSWSRSRRTCTTAIWRMKVLTRRAICGPCSCARWDPTSMIQITGREILSGCTISPCTAASLSARRSSMSAPSLTRSRSKRATWCNSTSLSTSTNCSPTRSSILTSHWKNGKTRKRSQGKLENSIRMIRVRTRRSRHRSMQGTRCLVVRWTLLAFSWSMNRCMSRTSSSTTLRPCSRTNDASPPSTSAPTMNFKTKCAPTARIRTIAQKLMSWIIMSTESSTSNRIQACQSSRSGGESGSGCFPITRRWVAATPQACKERISASKATTISWGS